ncbi:MAG: hypothetical protein M1522_00330 [Actinobacteria bacterium]|nr:hypothetical protein [Actinomycetota bacterium]
MDVGIDLDGCVYPFVEVLREWICRDTGRSPETLPIPERWGFEAEWGFSLDEFHAHVARSVGSGVMFWQGGPIAGAIEALRQIAEAGHRIHIVTARFVNISNSKAGEALVAEATRSWLQHHNVPYTSLIFSDDKMSVATDIFIDDSPDNYAALELAGANPWFFDCPWNASLQGQRVHTWAQFVTVVAGLAGAVAR